MVPNATAKAFEDKAENILSFQCGSCHSRKTHGVKPCKKTDEEILVELVRRGFPAEAAREMAQKYDNGMVGHQQTYAELCERLASIQLANSSASVSDEEAKQATQDLTWFLKLIKDAERRHTLQLYHLLRVPRFRSSCCDYEHCFKCRTRGWHEGLTCAENMARIDGPAGAQLQMLSCEKCGVYLIKGDGCDTVTCVCGHSFNWSQRFQSAARLRDEEMAVDALALQLEVEGELKDGDDAATALHDRAVTLLHRYEGTGNAGLHVDSWTGIEADDRRRVTGAFYLSRHDPDTFAEGMSRRFISICKQKRIPTMLGIAAAAEWYCERGTPGSRFAVDAMAAEFIRFNGAALQALISEEKRLRDMSVPRGVALTAQEASARFVRLYGGHSRALRATILLFHVLEDGKVPESAVHAGVPRLLGRDTVYGWAKHYAARLSVEQKEEASEVAWKLLLEAGDGIKPFFHSFAERKGESGKFWTNAFRLSQAGEEAFMRNVVLARHGWREHDAGGAATAVANLWALWRGLAAVSPRQVDIMAGGMSNLIADAVDIAFSVALEEEIEELWATRYWNIIEAASESGRQRKTGDVESIPCVVVAGGSPTGRSSTAKEQAGPAHATRKVPDLAMAQSLALTFAQNRDGTDATVQVLELWALLRGFNDVIEEVHTWQSEIEDTPENFFQGLSTFWDEESDEEPAGAFDLFGGDSDSELAEAPQVIDAMPDAESDSDGSDFGLGLFDMDSDSESA